MKLLAAVTLIGSMMLPSAGAEEFVLVEKGRPRVSIHAPGENQWAGRRLAERLHRWTGAAVDVETGTNAPAGKSDFIAVGTPATNSVIRLLLSDSAIDLGEQGYALKTGRWQDRRVLVAGGHTLAGANNAVSELVSWKLQLRDAKASIPGDLNEVDRPALSYRILWNWDTATAWGSSVDEIHSLHAGWRIRPESAYTKEGFLAHFKRAVDYFSDHKLNGLIIWGFLRDEHGGLEAGRELSLYARRQNVRILPGVCTEAVYGGFTMSEKSKFHFRTWTREHPELRLQERDGTFMDNGICPSKPENQQWLREGTEWLFRNLPDIGGVNLENGDFVTCYTDDCVARRQEAENDPNFLWDMMATQKPVIEVANRLRPDAWMTFSPYAGFTQEQMQSRSGIKVYPPRFLNQMPAGSVCNWTLTYMDSPVTWPEDAKPPASSFQDHIGFAVQASMWGEPVDPDRWWAGKDPGAFADDGSTAVQFFCSRIHKAGMAGLGFGGEIGAVSPANELNYVAMEYFTWHPERTYEEFVKDRLAVCYGGIERARTFLKLLRNTTRAASEIQADEHTARQIAESHDLDVRQRTRWNNLVDELVRRQKLLESPPVAPPPAIAPPAATPPQPAGPADGEKVIAPAGPQDGFIALATGSIDVTGPQIRWGKQDGKGCVAVGIHTLPAGVKASDLVRAKLHVPRTDNPWTEDPSATALTMVLYHIDAADDAKVTLADGSSPPLKRIGGYRSPGAISVDGARFSELDVTALVKEDLETTRRSFAWRIEPEVVPDQATSQLYFPAAENADDFFPPSNRRARLLLYTNPTDTGPTGSASPEYSYEQACKDWEELPNRVTALGARHSPFHAAVYADGAVALAGTGWCEADQWLMVHKPERVLLSFDFGQNPNFTHVSREQWLADGHLPAVLTDVPAPPEKPGSEILYRMTALTHLLGADEADTGKEPLILRQRIEARNPTAAAARGIIWTRLSAMQHKPGVDPQGQMLVFADHTKQPLPYEGGRLRLSGQKLVTDEGRLRALVHAPEGSRITFHPAGERVSPGRSGEDGDVSDQPLLENLLRIELPVEAGGSAEVILTVPVFTLDAEQAGRLAADDFDGACRRTLDFWRRQLERMATFSVPEPALMDMLNAFPWQCMTKMDREPATGIVIPKVNALLYEAVWGHIAAWECNVLDYLGYHAEAREYMRPFLTWQGDPSTTCKAVGITDWSGYFGAPVPRYAPWNWAVHHGYVMWQLAEHALITGDQHWYEEILPHLLKAYDWTVTQLDTTRKTSGTPEDPQRAIGWGLFPPSVSTDLQDVEFSAFNDAWIYRGLATTGELLHIASHPRAQEVIRRAEEYRQDIRAAWQRAAMENPRQTLENGEQIPFVSGLLTMRDWRDTRDRTMGFSVFSLMDTGALHLGQCGVFGQGDKEMEWALRLMNEGPPEVRFLRHGVSTCEICFAPQFDYFLAIDDPVRAIEVLYSGLAGGMSRRTFSAWEFRGGIQFIPVANAEIVRQARRMLINERPHDELWLAQATPRAWLEQGRKIEVAQAPTRFGPVSYGLYSNVDAGRVRFEVDLPARRPPRRVRLRMRHPEGHEIKRVNLDGQEEEYEQFDREWIDLPPTIGRVRGVALFE